MTKNLIEIAMIAAVAENNVIGKDGKMPWPRLKGDLPRFEGITMGHPIIMGRKTYESIPSRFRPFEGRLNIILSSSANYDGNLVKTVPSMDAAIDYIFENDFEGIEPSLTFIGGGGGPYTEGMKLASRLYITEVHSLYEGDTFFPEIKKEDWKEVKRQHVGTHSYVDYVRK